MLVLVLPQSQLKQSLVQVKTEARVISQNVKARRSNSAAVELTTQGVIN
jgi:hypothetical protein